MTTIRSRRDMPLLRVVMYAYNSGLDRAGSLKNVRIYKPDVSELDFDREWNKVESYYDGAGIPMSALNAGKIGLENKRHYTFPSREEVAAAGPNHPYWDHFSHNGWVGKGAYFRDIIKKIDKVEKVI